MRLDSGASVPQAQVRLFNLTDLRAPPLAATTDASGHFRLSLDGPASQSALPDQFELGANYPNPFNPSTIIPYQLPASMHVRLDVFNLLGQRIATLVDGEQPAGFHIAAWDATDAAGRAVGAGVYLYRLSGSRGQVTRRMLLIDGQAGIAAGGPESAARGGGETAPAYGLTVSGPGLVPYVDPAFRLKAGMAPVEVVLETPGPRPSRAKVASGGILGDVDNNGRVDFSDALLVALYSLDSSTVMPNNGDISLGDVNADGQVDLSDAWVIVAYLNDPSDPSLPSGIGEPVSLAVVQLTDNYSGDYTPAWSPDGRRIAFQSDRDGDSEIYVMNAAGSGVTQLTHNGAGDWSPAWSPDGRRIAFNSDRDGDSEIYVMNAAGSGVTQLTHNDAGDHGPAWSPDGQRIAFNSDRDGDHEIYVMNAAGSGVTQLTHHGAWDFAPAWSPDGRRIAFSSLRDGDFEIYLMNAAGSGVTQLTHNDAVDWFPAWSPDGRRIAFESDRDGDSEIYVMNAAGSGVTQLTHNDDEDWFPAWSPDGQRIAFQSDRDGDHEIYVRTYTVTVTSVSPDLVVQSPWVSDNSLTSGQSFTLRATVRNRGDARSSSTTLHYYRSSNATITTTDTRIGTDPVRALATGASSTESIPLSAPSSAGTYYYGACVQSVSGESDTNNNCSPGVRVTVTSASPDLVVQSPGVSDNSLTSGQSFILRATVRNRGDARSSSTTLHYYRSSNATITTRDTRIGTDYVGPLGASRTSAESIRLSAPSSAGTYYYGACVQGVSGESDTNNNCSPGVRVTVEEVTGSPDLIVESVSVSDNTLTPGQSFILSATVRNQGTGASVATTLRYYRSSNQTISTRDTEVGTDHVRALGASRTSAESIPLTAPSSEGTYYYGACVQGVSGESDTNNNCSPGVHVEASEPDHGDSRSSATVVAWGSETPGELEAGDVDYFRVEVAESGDLVAFTTGAVDTRGHIEDSSGNVLASDDDGGAGLNFRVRTTVVASTYYIRVTGFTNGPYTLHVGSEGLTTQDGFQIELVFTDDFLSGHQTMVREAADRWEQIITNDLPDFSHLYFDSTDHAWWASQQAQHPWLGDLLIDGEPLDDLRIYVGYGDNPDFYGWAGPFLIRTASNTPILGLVSIDRSAFDFATIRGTLLHEIGHVLGIGTLWDNLLGGEGETRHFTGPRARNAFDVAGGWRYTGPKVPVEADGYHWKESVFGNELMSPSRRLTEEGPVSSITTESLSDLGYQVDSRYADAYDLPPAGKPAAVRTTGWRCGVTGPMPYGVAQPMQR